jgi:hypothetical protein
LDYGAFIICGIVGVAGDLTQKEDKIFRTMLILDTVRGEDSTGLAAVPKFGDSVVVKTVGPAFDLFASKKYDATMNKMNRAVIGHNRYATQGVVNKANAHPFEFQTLIGVHNGTLKNKHKLLDPHKFQVDSENLYHHIENNGLRDAIDIVDGAYALVWWNKDEETLNFLRNKERPLFYAYSKDTKVILWASEKWMIDIACFKHDLVIDEIKSVPVDYHYSFHIDNKGFIHKPKEVEMKQKEINRPDISYYTGGYFGNQYQGHRQQQQGFAPQLPAPTTSNVTTLPVVDAKKNLVSDKDIETYSNTKGVILNVVESDINTHGAKYVTLRDPLHPTFPISMYINRDTGILKLIGKSIKANVGKWCMTYKAGGFFRVSENEYEEIPDESPELYIYDDGKGHMLNKKEWETKFSNCEWCFDHLFAEDHGNRINDAGQCFCATCVATYPEIEEHAGKLKRVY